MEIATLVVVDSTGNTKCNIKNRYKNTLKYGHNISQMCEQNDLMIEYKTCWSAGCCAIQERISVDVFACPDFWLLPIATFFHRFVPRECVGGFFCGNLQNVNAIYHISTAH